MSELPKNNSPCLSSLYLYLTDTCNLACRHCWITPAFEPEAKNKKFLPLEKLKNIILEAIPLGLKNVKFTGGEPLLYPEFIKLLEFIRELKLRSSMETNGTLITDEIARSLKSAGTYHVAVSLDGANAQTHENLRRVKGSFASAVEGIQKIAEQKINFQIIMAVHRGNSEQIMEVAQLVKNLGAISLKINFINVVGRGAAMEKNGELLAVEEILELDRSLRKNDFFKNGLKYFSNVPMAFRSIREISQNLCTCNIKNILGILGSGKISICGIGEEIPELVFGEIGKNNLKEIWKNNSTLLEIRKKLPKELGGICGRCIVKGHCLGSCIADNYWRHQDFFSSGFWLCEEAFKKDLFPTNRLIS